MLSHAPYSEHLCNSRQNNQVCVIHTELEQYYWTHPNMFTNVIPQKIEFGDSTFDVFWLCKYPIMTVSFHFHQKLVFFMGDWYHWPMQIVDIFQKFLTIRNLLFKLFVRTLRSIPWWISYTAEEWCYDTFLIPFDRCELQGSEWGQQARGVQRDLLVHRHAGLHLRQCVSAARALLWRESLGAGRRRPACVEVWAWISSGSACVCSVWLVWKCCVLSLPVCDSAGDSETRRRCLFVQGSDFFIPVSPLSLRVSDFLMGDVENGSSLRLAQTRRSRVSHQHPDRIALNISSIIPV